MKWIYENNSDNTARFTLGVDGKRPLICFGINSSTAAPKKLDRTVNRVANEACDGKYDGWIMLNIYAQRATNPNDISPDLDKDLHRENLKHITLVFEKYPNAKVWAAWGNLILCRPYLIGCMNDILNVTTPYSLKWMHKGKLTAKGNPRHPLYLKKETPFYSFDIDKYLSYV